jgi:hypothetical protein
MPNPPRHTQISSSSNSDSDNETSKPRQKQKQKRTINLPPNGIIVLHSTNLLSCVTSPPLGMNDAVVTLTDAHVTYIMHISDYRRVDSGFAHLEGISQHRQNPFDYSGKTAEKSKITAFTNRETMKQRVVEQIRQRRKGPSSSSSASFSFFSECAPVCWKSPLVDGDDAEADTDTCEGSWLEIDSEGEEVCRGWQQDKRVQVQYVQHMSGNVVDAVVVDVEQK